MPGRLSGVPRRVVTSTWLQGRGRHFQHFGVPFGCIGKGRGYTRTPPGAGPQEPHGNLRKEDDRFVSMPWAGYASDAEIEKIVQSGCIGANKIAALRMDVDNLGRIFSEVIGRW